GAGGFLWDHSDAPWGGGEGGVVGAGGLGGCPRRGPLSAMGGSKIMSDGGITRLVAGGAPKPPQWAGLKFFNVYGPNEYHKGTMQSVAAHIFPIIKDGSAAKLFMSHHADYADGGQLRDFVWVGDCVDLVLWLLDHPLTNGIYNCGTGQARSFADLAGAVFQAMGMNTRIEYIPMPENIREKYQYFTEADTARLRAAGFNKPFTTLEDGMAAYVRQFLDSADPYR
nr:NAD-dependent epimerase/dehydratase family protein [Alphaproteobacteria bacterium]